MPNRMFVLSTKPKIWLNHNKQPRQDRKSYVQPIKNKIVGEEADKAFQDRMQINMVCDLRDPNGQNIAKMSGGNTTEVFVHVAGDDAPDTTESRRSWIEDHLAPAFNEVARTYEYPQVYAYEGDDTPDEPLPLSNYLMDEDVAALMKQIYAAFPMEEIADDSDTMEMFFMPTHMEHGREVLLDPHDGAV